MGTANADIEGTLELVGLPNMGTQAVSTFSLGMLSGWELHALVHNPELILDEPINGLDPVGIKEMQELFCRLVQEREITILLSSHILSEMEHTADRIGVIVDGMVVQEIDPREIKNNIRNGMEDCF